MTIRERLYTIGQALVSKPQVVEEKEKSVSGGFFDYTSGLVTQTTASTKLLGANTGWVYKNNDVIAKEVATIEFELFTIKIVGGEVVYSPVKSHPVLDLLDRFNEFTTSSDGFYNTVSHKNLAGDSFWYLEGKGANVTDIFLLQPDKVTLELGDPVAGQRVIKSYKYEDSVQGRQINETYDAEEIVHFKNPDPSNPYRGKSKVAAAAEAIDTDNLAIEANKGIFQRGMINNFILSTDNNLTQEQLKALRAELQANYGGSKNAFKAMILSGGLEPKSVSLTNKDMEFIEQQKWLRDKIMSIFGNTQSVLGVTEDVNRANAQETILNWKRTTIKAEMKNITDTLNEFLIPRYGKNLILTHKDPVPEDRSTKIEEVKTLIEANVITQDEARDVLGYDPVKTEGSDELRQRPTDPIVPIPKSIKNVDYERVLRKNGIYKLIEKDMKTLEITRQMARLVVKSRKKSDEPIDEPMKEHQMFTNEEVWGFHNKQIRIVESLEAKFENKVKQFIDRLVAKAIAEVPDEIPAMKSKALLDEDEMVIQAQIDFAPILKEVALLSGQQALSLINDDSPYIATDLDGIISESVNKFAHSMVETDRDKIIDIIAEGVANGDSVPKIRTRITDTFEEYSKTQANRITRTEVIRASNYGALDAWEKSDVVVGKQWLTAMDDRVDPECRSLNGKILGLNGVYEKNDYLDVEVPPLHPNCRCTLLPVLEDQKTFDAETSLKMKELELDKAELEEKLDKRTKKYKELKEKDLKLEEHVKELEKLVVDGF